MSAGKVRRGSGASLLTRPLGLEGWSKLEPIVLAALASEEPMLLIGRHGTAKSFLLERLAEAVGLEYRFYNASLVNYDDLVGIPVPNEEQTELRYIATPTAIWDAEVVFIDELNRTRPDLQNKLFPLIHERRVQGIDLPKLRYRWAAMNPPAEFDGDSEPLEGVEYLGAEPLDPALADRFVFLIEVPEWKQLRTEAKRRVLMEQFSGRQEFKTSIPELIARARRILEELHGSPPVQLASYLVTVESILRSKKVYLSTRRMTMLLRAVLAIQAARVALLLARSPKKRAEEVDWENSALLALQHGDLRPALGGGSRGIELLEIHQHAWQVCGLGKNDPWHELLTIDNPVDRLASALAFGHRVGDDDLGALVLDAVASEPVEARRSAMALACYLAVQRDRDVAATVIETLAKHVGNVLVPNDRELSVGANQMELPREVQKVLGPVQMSRCGPVALRDRYLANLLKSRLPHDFKGVTPAEVASLFQDLWERFHLGESRSVAAS